MEMKNKLMLGLPKGSLEETTTHLFAKAGYEITKSSRSYRPSFDDRDLDGRFVRAQEVSRYVEHGYFDCGLTGQDWVCENESDVVEVCDLVYSRASRRRSKWVVAVPEASNIQGVEDLEGKRIATEVVGLTRAYLKSNQVNAEVEFSWGATEVKVPDLVDAIVDLTETGNSLRANKLRIVDTIMETNTVLIANKESWEIPEKRAKIEQVSLLLQAALEAHSKVGLKLNIQREQIDAILQALPALRNPTINRLTDEAWVAVDVIVDEKVVREIIPQLKAAGAEGIVEYPLNKVVY
ncbi:MAG: ATP phosphoribosyltransferase [Opitutia bacterium UBA7350]|nr:MAG: ATP phosphoribosyltransferase [Opitutae bacterium UBA7350]